MPKVSLFNQDGSQVEELELSASVFGIEPNKDVLTEAIIMQRASARQGTHAVKNRSAVRGGGKKPWMQKGTGQARHGSIRSPHWVGGGVVFGPTPRSYRYNLPKKMRRLALKSALSLKVAEGNVIALEDIHFDQPKTKDFIDLLDRLEIEDNVLLVLAEKDENVIRSANNLQGVKVLTIDEINVLDIIKYEKMILMKEVAESMGGVFA